MEVMFDSKANEQCGSHCPLRTLHKIPAAEQPYGRYVTTDPDSCTWKSSNLFEPLKPWQTRMLVLSPGSGISTLHSELIIVDLIDSNGCGIAGTSEIIAFEALSYHWGNSKPTYSIVINSCDWAITKELAFALYYLRSPLERRYIWCDALCINQADLVEKAAQIRSMLRIFEKAKRVVAWLGEPHLYSERLCKAFQCIPESQNLQAQQHEDQCLEVIESLTQALRHHLSSPWFVRTWVRQEVFAARDLVLYLGSHTLDFKLFLDRVQIIHDLCNLRHRLVRPILIPSTLDTLRKEYQHWGTDLPGYKNNKSLRAFAIYCLNILKDGKMFSVTDEKDRIYGMIGILTSPAARFVVNLPNRPDALAKAYPINYSKSIPVVYENFIKFVINETQNLCFLDVFRPYPRNPEFASWAVDWRERSSQAFIPFGSNEESYQGMLTTKVPLQDYDDVGKLRLLGIQAVGRISLLDGLKDLPYPRRGYSPFSYSALTDRTTKSFRERVNFGSDDVTSSKVAPRSDYVHLAAAKFEEDNDALLLRVTPNRLQCSNFVTTYLVGDYYVFAYTNEQSCFHLNEFRYLVPRHASLDDIIVSFEGSLELHLLRKVKQSDEEYTYLGTVAIVLLEDELVGWGDTAVWEDDGSLVTTIQSSDPWYNHFRPQQFILV